MNTQEERIVHLGKEHINTSCDLEVRVKKNDSFHDGTEC